MTSFFLSVEMDSASQDSSDLTSTFCLPRAASEFLVLGLMEGL